MAFCTTALAVKMVIERQHLLDEVSHGEGAREAQASGDEIPESMIIPG